MTLSLLILTKTCDHGPAEQGRHASYGALHFTCKSEFEARNYVMFILATFQLQLSLNADNRCSNFEFWTSGCQSSFDFQIWFSKYKVLFWCCSQLGTPIQNSNFWPIMECTISWLNWQTSFFKLHIPQSTNVARRAGIVIWFYTFHALRFIGPGCNRVLLL